MRGYARMAALLLLFLCIPAMGRMASPPNTGAAWNWQRFSLATGEKLEKAEKAVSDLRYIDESFLPRTEEARYTVIQDDRVLVVYGPMNRRQMAFVFSTDGGYVYGVSFAPDYDYMDIQLSPYEKGILILDWRYLPCPTVTFVSEKDHGIQRFIADKKYLEFPREPGYSAVSQSKSEVIEDDGGKVVIRNESGEFVTLFDYSDDFQAQASLIEENRNRNRWTIGAMLCAILLSAVFLRKYIEKNS